MYTRSYLELTRLWILIALTTFVWWRKFLAENYSCRRDKTDFGKPEVTSSKEKSEGTVVKVALQAVIRENYWTFWSYGRISNFDPFDYSFGDHYWKMKNESIIKNWVKAFISKISILKIVAISYRNDKWRNVAVSIC